VPAAGTPEYIAWRANIASGIRAAKLRRREVGLVTPREVAVELALPVKVVKEIFPLIKANSRYYIRRGVVNKWLAETGGETAA
jgi:hypothetical protein